MFLMALVVATTGFLAYEKNPVRRDRGFHFRNGIRVNGDVPLQVPDGNRGVTGLQD